MSVIPRIRREYGLKIVIAMTALVAHSHALAQAPSATSRGCMYIEGDGVAGEAKDVQIARAIAAGPTTITGEARIVGVDSVGKATVLREGGNGFVCQPGNPAVVGRPASCANAAALRWSADLGAGAPHPTKHACRRDAAQRHRPE